MILNTKITEVICFMNVIMPTSWRAIRVAFLGFYMFLVSSIVYGQSLSLTGKIKDAFTHKEIKNVVVTMLRADSTIIQDSLTTWPFGDYTFWVKKNMPRIPQKLIVKVAHSEYETAYLSYQLKNIGRNTQIWLPDIFMERKVSHSFDLNEVVVRPTKIKMVQRGDTIIYDATAFNLSEGSMLDDLVRELPGAELKSNGEIFVNGKKVDYLMLNSREFFRGNNQVMLRNLPYYTVKDIKVYNRTTDLSAFLGREAENKEYVMDVQLKKEYRQGYLGNVEAGYGTHKRYAGRAFALRFTDNSRITLYGSMNNTNDGSLPYSNGQWGGAFDANGERQQNMAGGEIFWSNPDNNISNGLKVMVTDTKTNTEKRTTVQSFLADGSNVFSRSQSMSDLKVTNLNFYDYWKVTKKWVVSGYIYYDHNSMYSNISDNYVSSLIDMILSDTLSNRSSMQYSFLKKNECALQADLNRKLAWGDEVMFEAKYKHSSAEHELFGKNMTTQYNTVGSVQKSPVTDYRHEYDKANRSENHYSMKARYTVPFLDGPTLSFTYNPTFMRVNDKDNIFRLDFLQDWSLSADKPLRILPSMAEMMASCVDLDNTYNYQDKQVDHKMILNLGMRKSTKKGATRNVEFEFPFSLHHESMSYARGVIDTIGSRNYIVIIPKLKYESIWKEERYNYCVSTSFLTSAADMLQLMPFRDDRNPLMVKVGNPDLKQSWIYSAETSLSMRLRSHSQLLSFGASANVYGNQIANGFSFNSSTGVYTYKPDNVNGNWDIKGNANYSISFGKDRCFTFENNGSATFLHSVDIASVDDGTQAALSKVNTTLVNDKASLAYSKEEMSVEAFGGVTLRHTASVLDMFEAINATDFIYGVNGRYTIPVLNLTMQTDLTMYSRRGYGSRDFDTNDFIWNATLSRPFFKGKLVVYADAKDILKNRRSTQYAVNAQGRTVTWQRSMPSYAMVRAQWRFNYNPKKK